MYPASHTTRLARFLASQVIKKYTSYFLQMEILVSLWLILNLMLKSLVWTQIFQM